MSLARWVVDWENADGADLSAISPFFIPAEQPTPLPPGHSLERVSLLIRHSAILGNDDEFEQTMGPFITKINGTDKSKLPSQGPWSFLRDYESPIVEDTLEKISDRGKNDAKVRCGPHGVDDRRCSG